MAEVATVLGGLKSTLEEVRTAMSNAKPPLWMLLPAIIGFVGVVGTMFAFSTSVQAQLAAIATVTERRDAELTIIRQRLDVIEKHDYEELRTERDYLRSKAG